MKPVNYTVKARVSNEKGSNSGQIQVKATCLGDAGRVAKEKLASIWAGYSVEILNIRKG